MTQRTPNIPNSDTYLSRLKVGVGMTLLGGSVAGANAGYAIAEGRAVNAVISTALAVVTAASGQAAIRNGINYADAKVAESRANHPTAIKPVDANIISSRGLTSR